MYVDREVEMAEMANTEAENISQVNTTWNNSSSIEGMHSYQKDCREIKGVPLILSSAYSLQVV